MRWVLAVSLLVLGGCSKELNEKNVREFIDEADHAYLSGHAADMCSMRSDQFKFTGTTFKLAEGRTVSNLAEAMQVDAERAAGARTTARVVTINASDYCRMAIEQRQLFRRVSLVRTGLQVSISPDKKRATAKAHYVEKSPEYGYGESSISAQDSVEHQVGTLQTETDDESVIEKNAEGKLVFMSTRAISRQFRVPKERDSRL